MQPIAELGHLAAEFRVVTAAGSQRLSHYHGQWLALMYCPQASCVQRLDCLEVLRGQERQISALGGRVLIIHPPFEVHERRFEGHFLLHDLDVIQVGTLADPGFIKNYQVASEDGHGSGITGVFLIDPQGKLRAAAHYMACAPVLVSGIAGLMQAAIDRFGACGTRVPEIPGASPVSQEHDHGCVAWYMYR